MRQSTTLISYEIQLQRVGNFSKIMEEKEELEILKF